MRKDGLPTSQCLFTFQLKDSFGFDYFRMAIASLRLTIAIALILGLISAVLYVTTQNMHVSGQTNEPSENNQQSCVNPRTCIPSSTSSPHIKSVFLFVYLKEGGIAGISERSSYDSFTKQLVFLDGLSETEQAQIVRITPETESNLKNMIRSSNLQRIQSNYPPTPGSADYFTYTLFVILDGRIHAVAWTDTSPNAPEELFEIAQLIESLRSTTNGPVS
jgi:hypothetical protein